jgi:menaquinone-dependent protoporphyrinogen oxidase
MTVLIAYGTKYGTTADRASSLGAAIRARMPSVTVTLTELRRGPGPDPDAFDAVLVGGSVYGGTVLPRVISFCERNEQALLTRPVGLFSCCLARGRHALEQMQDSFPDWLWKAAFCRGLPGGALYPSKLRLVDRILVRSVPHPPGDVDLRDPEQIDSIAAALAAALT